MKSSLVLALLAQFISLSSAAGVIGKAEGFGASTAGGGSATPASPKDIAELKTWLSDSVARVIVLEKEYNFIGSEGKVTEQGCRPESNTCVGNGGQDAINGANWCSTVATKVSVTYDKAGVSGLTVGSNKSLVGVGSKGVIRGKGLRIANGAQNVIIQNVHITELNPQYIWGGDAITLAGTDLIWIDHVKTSLIGRQHLVTGGAASNRVTISNSEFDGQTSWSASCDNRHYWAIYFTGSNDMVTFKGNYIHHTSGRSPKVIGNTLLHAVNNYWYSNSGHAFDIGAGAMVLAEGNMMYGVTTPLLTKAGQLYSSATDAGNAACKSPLGHNCVKNSIGNSGSFVGSDTSFFSNFAGKTVASAAGASQNVALTAGVGKI